MAVGLRLAQDGRTTLISLGVACAVHAPLLIAARQLTDRDHAEHDRRRRRVADGYPIRAELAARHHQLGTRAQN